MFRSANFGQNYGFTTLKIVENHSYADFFHLQILSWVLICETTIMFVSTCVIKIADFSTFWDGPFVSLWHILFYCYIIYNKSGLSYYKFQKCVAIWYLFDVFVHQTNMTLHKGCHNIPLVTISVTGLLWPLVDTACTLTL